MIVGNECIYGNRPFRSTFLRGSNVHESFGVMLTPSSTLSPALSPLCSHVPYTHHKTVGNRAWAGPVPLTLTGPLTAKGFNGTWERMVPMGPMTRKDPSKVRGPFVEPAGDARTHLSVIGPRVESLCWHLFMLNLEPPMAPDVSYPLPYDS